jgi:hypothetical protein
VGTTRWIAFFALAAIACGGGGTFIPRNDGGTQHLPDFAGTVVDLSFPPGSDLSTENPDLSFNQQPDFSTMPMPDLAVKQGMCMSPADCPGNDPICCASVTIGNGQLPQCPITAINPICAPNCATNLPLACPANAIAALCQQGADCKDGNYPYCCLIQTGGLPITACVSDIYKALATQCF